MSGCLPSKVKVYIEMLVVRGCYFYIISSSLASLNKSTQTSVIPGAIDMAPNLQSQKGKPRSNGVTGMASCDEFSTKILFFMKNPKAMSLKLRMNLDVCLFVCFFFCMVGPDRLVVKSKQDVTSPESIGSELLQHRWRG